jgi:flagellar basal-body rod protein FlgB
MDLEEQATMTNLIDRELAFHSRALAVGARRLELLAENLANADTPNFKARDVDFRTVLQGALDQSGRGDATTLRTTRVGHLQADAEPGGAGVMFRIPNQPALDGNTVDSDLEKAAFAEASVRYQASVDFLSARVESLRRSLRGE